MKKRALALCLAMALALTLVACGGGNAPADSGDADTTVDGTVDQQPATPLPETAPAVEEEPGETQNADGSTTGGAATPDSMETVQQPAAPAEKPQSQPAQKPVETPVQTPSASAESTSVDLAAFCEDLTAGNEDWPAMMDLEGETLDAFYAGLSAIATRQRVVRMAMISATAVEIALVEVENAADVQAVKDLFQARIDYQVGTDGNPGGAWYPEPTEMWKNQSRIVSNGNYVMLVVQNQSDAAVEAFNALFA